MRLWLAASVLTSGIIAQIVENHIEPQIKNWDTMNYLTMDCNHELFDIHSYSNENVTIYASLCRFLPQSTIIEAKLPSSVDVVPSNLLMIRRLRGNVTYYFKNLTKNNGITVQEDNPQVRIYWNLPDISQNFYMVLKRGSTPNVNIVVEDEYFQTNPQLPSRRFIDKSILTLTYGGPGTSAALNGIFINSTFRVIVEVSFYILVGLALILPEQMFIFQEGKATIRELLLYWISINFITDLTIELIGEHLPGLNLLLIMLLPTICSFTLMSKFVTSRIDVRWNSRLLFYIVIATNYLIVSMFYTSTMIRNDNYVLPVIYIILIPLAARYLFKFSMNTEQFNGLLLHYLVSVMIVLRVLQVFERPRGMLLRTFGSPLMGDYTFKASAGMAAILLTIPYQYFYLAMLGRWPTTDGAYKAFHKQESAKDWQDDKSLSKL